MPELPEVETVRRGLAVHLLGRSLARVEVLDARLVQPARPAQVEEELAGRYVTALERRGKYLLVVLDGGELVATHHLRMTGSFAAPGADTPAHVRMRYWIEGVDDPLVYNDPRRFGTLELASWAETMLRLDAKLGPEPLGDEWDAAGLRERLRTRRGPLKAALLDQRVVAGLGNIYVDEACFLAGIRPQTSSDRVGRAAAEHLVIAVRERLQEAIDVGGSTLRDYRGVEGEVGGMQERFLAYGRAGKPCLRCGTTMQGMRIAGRSTTWCPRCQPATRAR